MILKTRDATLHKCNEHRLPASCVSWAPLHPHLAIGCTLDNTNTLHTQGLAEFLALVRSTSHPLQ